MSRITKSKIYKPFIALLVAFILVFSFEVNKPKAIAPILAYGAYLIGGIVAEEVLEMGIRHVTSSGKTNTKSRTMKIADEIFSQYEDYDFDMFRTNPKRKADGSLEVYPSANDRAKIARKIADEFDDLIDEEISKRGNSGFATFTIVPGMAGAENQKASDFMNKMFYKEHTEGSSSTSVMLKSIVTDKALLNNPFSLNHGGVAGNQYQVKSYFYKYQTSNPVVAELYLNGGFQSQAPPTVTDQITLDLFDKYQAIKSQADEDIYFGGGMLVPGTLKKVYPAPANMSPTQQLPNYQELSNKPINFGGLYPSSGSDEETSWEMVNTKYEADTMIFDSSTNQKIDDYMNVGTYNKDSYNTQTVNNYYTDKNYPVKSGDITIIVDVDVPPPVVIDDDDDTPTGDLPPQAEVLDRTLISYAKQTYDYLGDSIDGAITSMRDITDDASGLVDYLDTSFRWLPAEWRALFGSAFILGVFAHFMRR